MLLEYCDRGSLQRAIERGKLQSRAPGGGPDLVSSCDFCTQPCHPMQLHCMLLLSSRAPGIDKHDGPFKDHEMSCALLCGCRCTC